MPDRTVATQALARPSQHHLGSLAVRKRMTRRCGKWPDMGTAACALEPYVPPGWPTMLDSQGHLAVVTGSVVDAVVMPRVFGEPIAMRPEQGRFWVPVISAGMGRWWTFLTAPSRRASPVISAPLRTMAVRAIPRGGHVVLPLNGQRVPRGMGRAGAVLPRAGCGLPPWPVVVALAERAVRERELS